MAANMNKAGVSRITPMTKQEAIKILGLEEKYTDDASLDIDEAHAHFIRMFTQNDPENGGSFYLQSKIYRAQEQLEKDLLKEKRITKEKLDALRNATEQILKSKKAKPTEQQEATEKTA